MGMSKLALGTVIARQSKINTHNTPRSARVFWR